MRSHRWSSLFFLAAALFLAACPPSPYDSADMEIWQLTDYLENATDLATISGVYWSARATELLQNGNHHFIVFVYHDAEQRDDICGDYGIGSQSWTNPMGLEIFYSTVSAFSDTGELEGDLIESFCWPSDCLAVKQGINPAEYLAPGDKNYRLEAHRVPLPLVSEEYRDEVLLMRGVIQKAVNFNAHYEAGRKLAFQLRTANCTAMVSSLFGALGVSMENRMILGEFKEMDVGVEFEIPFEYFDPL